MSTQSIQSNSFNVESFSKENKGVEIGGQIGSKKIRTQDSSENKSKYNDKYYNTQQLAHFFQNLMTLK